METFLWLLLGISFGDDLLVEPIIGHLLLGAQYNYSLFIMHSLNRNNCQNQKC